MKHENPFLELSGLGKPHTFKALTQMINSYSSDLLFLSETKKYDKDHVLIVYLELLS